MITRTAIYVCEKYYPQFFGERPACCSFLIPLAWPNLPNGRAGMFARSEAGCVMGQMDLQEVASEVVGDVSGLIHKAEAQLRRLQPEADRRPEGLSNLSSVIQRICQKPVLEIEKLIVELQALRDYLQNEGQRVQREITEYAHLSQAAIKSTRAITESLATWKVDP